MPEPSPIPANKLSADDFLEAVRSEPGRLVYFLCNVGDGDAQVILLPVNEDTGHRQAILIDAASSTKSLRLLSSLVDEGIMAPDDAADAPGSIPLVIATHPHSDHIRGMERLLETHALRISEFWDPGYYHTTGSYQNMMRQLEENDHIDYAQPASGHRKWIGDVALTVLSPSIQLRNRFDTYGTNINDSSLSVRLEFPAARLVQRDDDRVLLENQSSVALILGADAQTLSWSFVLTDFPYLPSSDTAAAKALKAATGQDLLKGNILKVSHHCSKHGVNLELIERIHPQLTLVSSVAGGGNYSFPHQVAQDLIREGLEPTTSSGEPHQEDWELGMFYTCDSDTNTDPLGSIAAVMSGTRGSLWRFGDERDEDLDLASARLWEDQLRF